MERKVALIILCKIDCQEQKVNRSPRTSQELVRQSRHGAMKACSNEVNSRMERREWI